MRSEKELEELKEEEYKIPAYCSNCGYKGNIAIERGQRISDGTCPHCGCVTLTRDLSEKVEYLPEKKSKSPIIDHVVDDDNDTDSETGSFGEATKPRVKPMEVDIYDGYNPRTADGQKVKFVRVEEPKEDELIDMPVAGDKDYGQEVEQEKKDKEVKEDEN